jgi:hypothetical protein
MSGSNASQNPRSTATDQARLSLAPLSRLAGPLAVAAGILMIAVELPPWGVGLGLAMVWLGVWMLRTPTEVVS